ncbi:transcriptional regulator with XRE-family HTH domain [Sinorhizobium kostiense]|uniref:Transcriptional regulator with XRE-family HTH domain n=1 Tax=Sinorhizobium kostiense TaxID=76747 RepID=A0ABS4R909_9HYPH|nr:helix-turn-helix transcriptional regulator [Sinorhizobium kostiense]MBP2238800.1 transcriptional regulator with XRE-family HTH domain [Sinorhizobium kostiense]
MAGPSLEQWISDRGLQQVNDPDVDKPVYRLPPPTVELHSAPRWKKESPPVSGKPARGEISPGRKLAPLLDITEAVYARYEGSVSRLTVSRLIHLCEVLGASPEELLAPAALHLSGENQTKVNLLLARIDKLRGFDEETLQDVFSLLNRLGTTGHGGNGTASAAPLPPGPPSA